MSLSEKTYQLLKPYSLSGARLVVGVSGGADSLALLHVLHGLTPRLGWHLTAATLDHGLRGQHSADDAAFVAALCHEWGVPVVQGFVDVAAQAASGIEAAARTARYHFLAETARSQGAAYIAVAHHAGDQAETILMHILRGAGINGLRGMQFLSPLPDATGITLLRPFLYTTRAEIEFYCDQHGLKPRHDATNEDTHYLRNHLRQITLPDLRQLNPQADQAIIHLAEQATLENDYIQQALDMIMPTLIASTTPQRITIQREAFLALHPALQHRLLHHVAQQLGSIDVGYSHIRQAAHVAAHPRQGAAALLPNHIQLRVDYAHLVVEVQGTPADYDGPLLAPTDTHAIMPPAVIELAGWRLHSTLLPPDQPALALMVPHGAALHLRTRRPGDRFAPLGLGGQHQTLKKWLIDHKIPVALRPHLPVLTLDHTVVALYVNGDWIRSEPFAPSEQAQVCIYFHFTQSPRKT